jgi:hypothetical protein
MPHCPYCGKQAVLTDSVEIYGRSYGMVWLCRCLPELSYVGCHKGTEKPLGTLANAETRTWRKKAHKKFDPLWKSGTMTRKAAYAWLQEALHMTADEGHIAKFNIHACAQLIGACTEFTEERHA